MTKLRFISALFAVSLLISSIALTHPVSAHTTRVDGPISVQLHIEPNDLPVDNVPTHYLLSFRDQNSVFSLADCTCGVQIQANGKTISTVTLGSEAPLATIQTFTFPKPGVYTMIVSGTPKSTNTFSPFSVSYSIRVDQNPDQKKQTDNTPLYFAIGVAAIVVSLLVIGTVLIIRYNKKYKGKQV